MTPIMTDEEIFARLERLDREAPASLGTPLQPLMAYPAACGEPPPSAPHPPERPAG